MLHFLAPFGSQLFVKGFKKLIAQIAVSYHCGYTH